MTLWARRDVRNPAQVKVTCTYGPITFDVTEDPGHLRAFWSQLGTVLNEVEHPAQEAAEG